MQDIHQQKQIQNTSQKKHSLVSDFELDRLHKHRTKVFKTIYEEWRKHPVYCPALEKYVYATKTGWEHIAGLSKYRTPSDTHRRLALFHHARKIVEKSGTVQFIRYQNDQTHYTFEAVVQHKEFEQKGRVLKKVKVVVVEKKDGRTVFHSVMD